ncbi:MAG: prolipoprotein diacylglyceryl transferase [Acidimicrobiia bacterium]|nr:prolipoprotein diacylglyceryl transferase [Acidimicrobiia bacterium]
MLLASIPSPSFNEIPIGPLDIHIYGLLIGLGVLVAAITITRRYAAWGGDAEMLERVILWTVVLGFVGARLAYVSTHLGRFEGRWYAVFFVWEGGLALFGGLTAGALTAVTMLRRSGGDPWAFADAGAVGLPLAQGIGRWGNYFNQELFGTPTDLPWGLEIDVANRPAAYLDSATFHPTFLYESLWNVLLLVPLVLWLEHRVKLARGSSIALYMVLYGAIRFLTELIRTDTTFRFLGLSRNGWVASGVVLAGIALLVRRQRVGEPQGAGRLS